MKRTLQQLKLEILSIKINLSILMKVITYFVNLEILLLIYSQGKKDIFAMIRQLSLPTWFMSLSAADTRWTGLLKMLAKLNNGVSYTDKDIEELTWQ